MAQPTTVRTVVDVSPEPGAHPVDPGDDARLIVALRAGSEAAFALLVDRHRAPMLRVARFYVGSGATAEDVVQETWLAVIRGIDRFDGRSTLKTWMYRILINRAKTAAQREDRMVAVADMDEREVAPTEPTVPADRFARDGQAWARSLARPPPPWQPLTDDHVVTSEAVGLVLAAIAELPPTQRLAITLRDVDCWSAREVCHVLDLSDANQRVLLHRARSKVRTELASYFESGDDG